MRTVDGDAGGGSGELPHRDELSSWKEIADHLGVSVRTAQDWEETRGLPVRRYRGTKGRVTASAAELSTWQAAVLGKPHWWARPRFLGAWSAAGTVLLLVAVGVILGQRLAAPRPGKPSGYRVEPGALIVTDGSGRELWRKLFDAPLNTPAYGADPPRQMVRFENIDQDPGIETLFNYEPANYTQHRSALICFSEEGREKWRFVAGRAVSDQRRAYSPYYMVSTFFITSLGKGGPRGVVVSSHHAVWWPHQVAVLDGNGRLLGEYWHSGRLYDNQLSDLDGDGVAEVLLAGYNIGYHATTLVVLDPRKVAGASRQEPGDPDQLQGFSEGTEKARIIFPRTCINAAFENWTNVRMNVAAESIRITSIERMRDPAYAVTYTLDRQLRLTGCRWDEALIRLHRELEKKRVLDHRLTEQEMAGSRKLLVARPK